MIHTVTGSKKSTDNKGEASKEISTGIIDLIIICIVYMPIALVAFHPQKQE